MNMKILSLCVLLMSAFTTVYAQKTAVKGIITDANNKPLSGANIVLDYAGQGAVSNTRGEYEIVVEVIKESAALSVSMMGYETQTKIVEIKPNETVRQDFMMQIASKMLAEVIISRTTILGSKRAVLSRTGSAYYVSPEELKRFAHTDINRVLATVPGVSYFEEDGYGLRPNISLRGSAPSRTSKITVMEDGVLAAPAPYASPAAYYFPTIGRMDAVEILKGSSQIQYGPFTTGGAINFVSARIPEKLSGRLDASYGAYNSARLRATLGNSKKYYGFVVDYLKYSSDGFKKIDNFDKKGFDRNDVVAKFRVNTDMDKLWTHALEIKGQYSDENSDETYLGLTQADYNASPFRRYAATQKDNMLTDHSQVMATYTLAKEKNFLFNITAYYNTFGRNWYKLDRVTLNNERPSLGAILASPDKYPDFVSLLKGETDNTTGALSVKANKRTYTAKGIQAKVDYHFKAGELYSDIEAGLRTHYDEEDRFQFADNYNMTAGTMVLSKKGAPGSDANRITFANATSGYLLYKLRYKNLYVTPGLRYEHITIGQKDYGKKDPDRVGGADYKETKNPIGGTFIPGIGANYRFSDKLSLFAGVHRGFAPPGSKAETKPEKSINYELGTRLTHRRLYAELVGFMNQYSNMLGSDLVATGGTGTLNQFNAGKVNVSGLEFLLNYNLMPRQASLSLPVGIAYTLTNTSFKNEFKSNIWGDVKKGDEIPYIAKHQLSVNAGAEYSDFSVLLNARYSSGFRTKAGTGAIPQNEKAGKAFVVDLSGKYAVTSQVNVTLSAMNVLDNRYIAALSPYGVRPGMPRTLLMGLMIDF